jgi:hypothetical protein
MFSISLVVIVVIFALTFDYINGFHDTANAIATSVSTKALSPRNALPWLRVSYKPSSSPLLSFSYLLLTLYHSCEIVRN